MDGSAGEGIDMLYSQEILDRIDSEALEFFQLCKAKFEDIYVEHPDLSDFEQKLYELKCWEVTVQEVIEEKTGKLWYEVVPGNIYLTLMNQGIFDGLCTIEFTLYLRGVFIDD